MAETMTAVADRFGDVPYVALSDDGRVEGFFCYSFNNETKEGIVLFLIFLWCEPCQFTRVLTIAGLMMLRPFLLGTPVNTAA